MLQGGADLSRGEASPIAVVVPAYRARATILAVLAQIGPEVDRIYVVDDGCPEKTGDLVEERCGDPRVTVLRNPANQGVGAATIAGYRAAAAAGAAVAVKIDADGQMDPALIRFFARPILSGHADYTKGNRLFSSASLAGMPRTRLFGNAVLSLMTKFSTGYWRIVDPTNGYTALHLAVLPLLPLDRVAKRFLFETDILYSLGMVRAVVLDVPLFAHYGEETSSLRIGSIILPFVGAHIARFWRRVAVNYFIRDFSFASLCLAAGLILLGFGGIYGLAHWIFGAMAHAASPVGTVVLSALSVMLGIQFILFFFSADIASDGRRVPLHILLGERTLRPLRQFDRTAGEALTDHEHDHAAD